MTHQVDVVSRALRESRFMGALGAHVLVDGQYGSTGKGLAAAAVAEAFKRAPFTCSTNAGPNSGHTLYTGPGEDKKVVLRHLPSSAVYLRETYGKDVPVEVNAGAVVDLDILAREADEHGVAVDLNANAAVIDPVDGLTDAATVEMIGSTGTGMGPAMSRKLMRQSGLSAVAKGYAKDPRLGGHVNVVARRSREHVPARSRVLIEVPQGYSLGVNRGFYPYCTSRECTVGQALLDADVHPSDYRSCMMVVRTFPIRVAGNSGAHYWDQEETSWGELGVEPEITTVTRKVRRVFTFSRAQFMDAVAANRPDVVLLNFCNYLNEGDVGDFVKENILEPYAQVMEKNLDTLLLGFGPRIRDMRVW